MKNAGPTIIIVGGVAMIIGAFVFFGKKKAKEEGSPVPVPYEPAGVKLGDALEGAKHYEFRGMFIRIARKNALSTEWSWEVNHSKDFNTANAAISGDEVFATDTDALSNAMGWVNAAKGGPLGVGGIPAVSEIWVHWGVAQAFMNDKTRSHYVVMTGKGPFKLRARNGARWTTGDCGAVETTIADAGDVDGVTHNLCVPINNVAVKKTGGSGNVAA
jgi:hypothetical protein